MKKLSLILSMMVIGLASSIAQESDAKMVFDYETFDYGTIMQDMEEKNGDSYFTFTNAGTEPLIITAAKGSCGCTTPDAPLNKPFMPGEKGKIKVHYDTKRVGNFAKQVTLTTNAGTYVLNIKGNVEPLPVDEATPGTAAPLKK